MTITIKLPPTTEKCLREEAQATGKDVGALVIEAVEAKIAHSKRTLKDALTPLQDAVSASGMNPEAAAAFLEQELAAVRAERRASKGQG